MKLYHFCADHMLKGILRDGLTLGSTPIHEPDPSHPEYFFLKGFLRDTQWLTTDPDWTRQSWCTSQAIAYRRDDWRLTVELGLAYRLNLLTAAQLCARKKLPASLYEGFPGSENWRVYMGRIPASKIVKVESRPLVREGALAEAGEDA